jgi:hypothetical protein
LTHPNRRGPRTSKAHPSIAAVLAWEKTVSGVIGISNGNFQWRYLRMVSLRCPVKKFTLEI